MINNLKRFYALIHVHPMCTAATMMDSHNARILLFRCRFYTVHTRYGYTYGSRETCAYNVNVSVTLTFSNEGNSKFCSRSS